MSEKVNPVGWFEIPVTDLVRAKEFYQHILEIRLEEREMGPIRMAWFPMKDGEYGAAGSLALGSDYAPSSDGVLVYFSTPDIDEALSRVEKNGGKILASKMSIGEYGYIGIFLDCEGNRIGLHSRL